MKSEFLKIGAVLILVTGISAAGCGSPEARKEKYLSQAQTYMAGENWPKARVSLRNVLKIDPRDAEAYFLFARVEEKEKNWRNAFGDYLKVVELKPDHWEAWIKVGRFYLMGGDLDKVTEAADKILTLRPGDPSAETLKAAVSVRKGNPGEAMARVEKVVAAHPGEPDAATLLASLYGDRKRWSDAERVLERAVQIDPDNAVLLSNLGNVQIRMGKSVEAEKSFQRIVSADPKEFDHWIRLAAYYDYRRDAAKAEAALREAVKREPEEDRRWLTLAEYLATHKDIREGEAALLAARKELSDSMKIRFALGKFYEAVRQPGKSREIYEEIVDDEGKTSPSGLEARVNLAAFDLADGKRDAAEKEIREVLEENPRAAGALLLQGRIALAGGDGREAVQSFRSLLRDQPERTDVHVLLGRAYLSLGERGLARESLMNGLAIDPRNLEGRRALALLKASEGKRREAQDRLKEIREEFPGDLESAGQLMTLQMRDRDWGGAEETLAGMREAGRKAGGGGFEAEMAEGVLREAREQWAGAEAAYERAGKIRPEAPEPLMALVRVQLNQKKAKAAEDFLRRVLSGKPDHPYAHGLLGEVLLLRGDAAGAERELQEAARLKPDWTAPWTDLAGLKLSRKKPGEAAAVLERGVKANPKADDLRILLAMAYGEAGRPDQAIQSYEAVLKNNPRAVLAANNLAVLLAEKKGDPESLRRALELTREFEKTVSNPLFLDTLGWVYVKMGQNEEALRVLRKAVKQVPGHPELNYHLGMAFYQSGKTAEARDYLNRALRSEGPFKSREEARTFLKRLG